LKAGHVEKKQAASEPGEGSPSVEKKKRGRGKGSSARFQKAKGRGGKALKDAGGDEWLARDTRLLLKWLQRASILQSLTYSLEKDGSKTRTGWQGKPPPPKSRAEIRSDYFSGAIKATLETFYPVPYAK
jgi:hypothetical protein